MGGKTTITASTGNTSTKGTTTSTTVSSSTTGSYLRNSWVWLWENYASGMTSILQNLAAVTVVSPNSYYLTSSGTFAINDATAEGLCPQIHSLGLKCEPLIQGNGDALNTLLTNSALESSFISSAINQGLGDKVDGLNIDFEPYGFSSGTIPQLSSQYASFLSNFALSAHAHNLLLSVDMDCWDGPYSSSGPTCSGGPFWNYADEAQTGVNLLIAMNTYNETLSEFESSLVTILQYVPVSILGAGFQTLSYNDNYLSQELGYAASIGISTVATWPSPPGFVTSTYWTYLPGYVA